MHFLKAFERTFMIMKSNLKKKIFFENFYFLSRNGGVWWKKKFEIKFKIFFFKSDYNKQNVHSNP